MRYLFLGVAFGLATGEDLAVGDAEVAGLAEGAGVAVAAGEGCCTGEVSPSGPADCKTECDPEIDGNESISASNMKPAAAPIVILLRMLAVPRGPNAVLETLLEKSAPASALPGCSSTVTTRMMQAKINKPYKR